MQALFVHVGPMREAKSLLLENDLLQVRIAPDIGGKITSLRSMRTGEEFFLPPLKTYGTIPVAANFCDSDGGGFDECLPSVAACESIAGEPPVPDHGDLWRLMWQVDSDQTTVVLHADAASRPLRLTRRASLQGSSLVLEYELANLSAAPTTWLWSAHPLLRVEPGDRIVLPGEINEVFVDYSATGLLVSNHSIAWPLAQTSSGLPVDFSEVAERDGVTAFKLFAQMGELGWGAIYRKRVGQGLAIRFAPSILSFLGLWICSGAWPEGDGEKQYTVGLEPTTSNTDSLASAERNGTARSLGGRKLCRWKLEIQLLGASQFISFKNFCACANEPQAQIR